MSNRNFYSEEEYKIWSEGIREELKKEYPKYEPLHDYLIDVLIAMGHQVGEEYLIHIKGTMEEPIEIAIAITPKYGH